MIFDCTLVIDLVCRRAELKSIVHSSRVWQSSNTSAVPLIVFSLSISSETCTLDRTVCRKSTESGESFKLNGIGSEDTELEFLLKAPVNFFGVNLGMKKFDFDVSSDGFKTLPGMELLDFCKWWAVRSARVPKPFLAVSGCDELLIFGELDFAWLVINDDNESKVLGVVVVAVLVFSVLIATFDFVFLLIPNDSFGILNSEFDTLQLPGLLNKKPYLTGRVVGQSAWKQKKVTKYSQIKHLWYLAILFFYFLKVVLRRMVSEKILTPLRHVPSILVETEMTNDEYTSRNIFFSNSWTK